MQTATSSTPRNSDEFEIPLGEIVAALLKSKRTVALLAVIGMAAVLGVGWHIGKYGSEGYFQLGMSFPEYKRLQASLAAPHRWDDFAKTRNAAELAPFAGIEQTLNDPKRRETLMEPIFPVTKAELKNIPEATLQDAKYNISGLRIAFNAGDPETAQHGVRILGDFVRDTAILMEYKDGLHAKHVEYLNNERKYENRIIDTNYQLQQVRAKRDAMQKILHNHPEAARMDNRQVVSITEGGERYLPPVTQLVALESQIADLNQTLPKIQREQRINQIRLAYIDKALQLIDQSTSGAAFLKALPAIKDGLELNLADEVEKSVYNSLAIDDINAQSRYVEKIRFVAEPILSSQRSPSPLSAALLGLMLGTLAGCIIVLFRHFSARQSLPPVNDARKLAVAHISQPG